MLNGTEKKVDTGDRSLDIFLGGCDQMQLDQCVFSLLCFVFQMVQAF